MDQIPSQRLALGILTRGRPQDAIDCVVSARATVGAVEFNVYVMVDEDYEAAFHIKEFVGSLCCVRVLPMRHYYVRGMNALYQWMRLCGEQYFVVSNDDVTFVEDGWGPYVIDKLNEYFPSGCGVLELAGPELCAHYASKVDFVEANLGGLIAEPSYTFYCSDTELRNVAKGLDRYRYMPGRDGRPLIQHHIKTDNIRSEVSYWMESDRETFKRRAASHPEWQREIWQ